MLLYCIKYCKSKRSNKYTDPGTLSKFDFTVPASCLSPEPLLSILTILIRMNVKANLVGGGDLVEDVVNPVSRGVGEQSLDIGVAVGGCLVGLSTRAWGLVVEGQVSEVESH